MSAGARKVISKTGLFLLAAGILGFSAFPFYWTLVTSLKDSETIFKIPITYWPDVVSLANYGALFKTAFFKGMYNSFVIAMITTFISLIVSTVAAYAFSRYDFKGRNWIRPTFVAIYMLPPILIMVPLFEILRDINLLNSLYALVVCYVSYTIPYALSLMIGFLQDIPIALEEASMIDGTNRFGAFMRIILPLVAPGLIASGIFSFTYAWNEFIYAMMFTNQYTQTLPVVLNGFVGAHIIQWGVLSAGAVLTTIPVAIMFAFIQKQLIQGLSSGAVKG